MYLCSFSCLLYTSAIKFFAENGYLMGVYKNNKWHWTSNNNTNTVTKLTIKLMMHYVENKRSPVIMQMFHSKTIPFLHVNPSGCSLHNLFLYIWKRAMQLYRSLRRLRITNCAPRLYAHNEVNITLMLVILQ